MSYILKYCSIRSQDHINSLMCLVRELKPVDSELKLKPKDGLQLNMDFNLRILHTISEICPGLVEKAISLIDYGKVSVYIERKSCRRLYLMDTASKGQDMSYLVMRHFCTCRSYIDKVVLQKKEITCKHELAYYLLDSMYVPEVIDSLSSNKTSSQEESKTESCNSSGEGKRGCQEEVIIQFMASVNPQIKAHIVDERRFSEVYLEHTSMFFVENGLFKKAIRQS
ncbi:hypothetical protein OJ253_1872 [Cryptosporidium canis]|uniref:SWIM-type domain-containing protein n=1 Tax=Cryptosporidium canis TaxID=195482 RepID=A0A9D5DGQ5_9CRYT|nr:hypothetical protein OJ253_1872 [Cryptosporidium canis]